jgi:hypothetical protein
MTATTNPAARLMDALEALPDEQLRGAFPVLLLLLTPHLGDRAWPHDLQRTLDAFLDGLGVEPDAPAAAQKAAIDAHLLAHHIDGSVWRSLTACLRNTPSELSMTAQKLVGSQRWSGVLARTAPPPQGAVAGGPLARFAAGRTLDKKAP